LAGVPQVPGGGSAVIGMLDNHGPAVVIVMIMAAAVIDDAAGDAGQQEQDQGEQNQSVSHVVTPIAA